MAKPSLEILKFGIYVFGPISVFYYFNLPEIRKKYILPDLPKFYPTEGITTNIPYTKEGNAALMERMQQQQNAKKN